MYGLNVEHSRHVLVFASGNVCAVRKED